MSTVLATTKCEGCLQKIYSFAGPVCFDCCKARARTAFTHRCSCGRKRRLNLEVHKIGSRKWQTCFRCLGTAKQLS